ncbi:MlaD family protein [Pelistega europaea]|uniref:MCE family protein n=1 Tax=Pelistega europaea TaxID=106147 RepID=A0A7Y4LB62_9BURK|nr:MlaD family protein [Pelistega europaea]NOL50313.1 MCE family protein [Pelistega europaea]
MEPKARHILIGLFTVSVVVGAMLFGLWLTHLSVFQDSYRYKVHFRESVSGLSRGSAVLFNGMNVGEVVDLWLDKQDPRYVFAEIAVQKKVALREGVVAKLQLMGITGQSVVSLNGGNPNKPKLVPEDTIFQNMDEEALPTIEATPSPLSALLEDGQNVISNLTEISVGMKNLFSDKNIQRLGDILEHINDVTASVANEKMTIQSIITQTDTTLKETQQTLTSFRKLAQDTNYLLTAEGKQALSSLIDATNSMKASSQKIQQLLANNEGNISQGLQGFKELTPAIIEFKRAFSTLQHILQNLEDKPAAYLLDGNALKDFKP